MGQCPYANIVAKTAHDKLVNIDAVGKRERILFSARLDLDKLCEFEGSILDVRVLENKQREPAVEQKAASRPAAATPQHQAKPARAPR